MKGMFCAGLLFVAMLSGPLLAAETVVFEAIPGAKPDAEGVKPFRIEVKDDDGTAFSQITHLMPGCDTMPAVSKVTFDGQQGYVLCGTWGGRPGTVKVIAASHGEWTQASLSSDEIHPQRHDLPQGQYFLTDMQGERPWGFGEHFEVYRLTATQHTFGFVRSDDQQARKIYTEVLKNYLDSPMTYSEIRRLGPVLDLVADTGLAPADKCAALATLQGRVDKGSRSELAPLITTARAQNSCH